MEEKVKQGKERLKNAACPPSFLKQTQQGSVCFCVLNLNQATNKSSEGHSIQYNG